MTCSTNQDPVAQAVYLSVFTNEVANKTPQFVAAAAEQAGVAAGELPALLQVFALPSFAEDYPAAVVAAVGRAQQEAVVSGVRYVGVVLKHEGLHWLILYSAGLLHSPVWVSALWASLRVSAASMLMQR